MEQHSTNRFITENTDKEKESWIFPNYEEDVGFELNWNPFLGKSKEELFELEKSLSEDFSYDVVSHLHDEFKRTALNVTPVRVEVVQLALERSTVENEQKDRIEEFNLGTDLILAAYQNGELIPVNLCPEKLSQRDDFWYYPVGIKLYYCLIFPFKTSLLTYVTIITSFSAVIMDFRFN